MKPSKIILVRHGESEANKDKGIYEKKPDFAVNLTEKGRKQARAVANQLQLMLINDRLPPWFYRSPFYRTRQTEEAIRAHFPGSQMFEDPRLREQEHTPRILNGEREDVSKERDEYGHFYYRFENGESCADVYDRVSDFIGTLFRDFEKEQFPPTCIIVSHGMTNRVFLMRFLKMTVEEFEFLRNPQNCGIYVLEKDRVGKYALTEEPRKYEKRNCIY